MMVKRKSDKDFRRNRALNNIKAAAGHQEGQRHMERMNMILERNRYIKNLINGRYFMARCNMIAVQIINKNILEDVDGAPKSEELMRAEYALIKMQSITSMREAYFAKQTLKNTYKQTDEEIDAVEKDYYDGKIMRESYDEEYRRGNKAEFVQHNDENKKS